MKRAYGRNKERKEFTLNKDLLAYIRKQFSRNNSDGADRCIHAYQALIKSTIEELAGHFTKEEVNSLVAAQAKATIDKDFQYSVQAYQLFLTHQQKTGIVEFIQFKRTLEKVGRLTSAQVYFLRESIEIAWHVHPNKSAVEDLIDRLTG